MAAAMAAVPVRWRVWVAHTALLASVLGGLSLALAWWTGRLLVDGEIRNAQEQARLVAARELTPPTNSGSGAPTPQPPGIERVARILVNELNTRDLHVAVFDDEALLVWTGPIPADLPVWPPPTPDELRAALVGQTTTRIVPDRTPRAARSVVPIETRDGKVIGAAALDQSLGAVDDAVVGIRSALLVGAALAVVVGALLGVPATGALLGPLGRIAVAAERAGRGELDARVGLNGRRDELGRLGTSLDRALGRVQAVLEAQQRFVADVDGALTTPLARIRGAVEALARLEEDEATPRRQALRSIEIDVERMEHLIDDLLALSRVAGDRPAPRATVDLVELVREVAEGPSVRGVPTSVEVWARPVVDGDREALRAALGSLIEGAAAGSSVRVVVDVRAGMAEVAVAGTPEGTAAESRLGRAIAQSIVAAHGGAVEATSRPGGRGAIITIQLPLHVPPPSGSGPGGESSAPLVH